MFPALTLGLALLAAGPPAQDPEPPDPRLEEAQRNRERLEEARALAARNNQRVLVLWSWKGDAQAAAFDRWRARDPAVARKILYEFRFVRLESLPPEQEDEEEGVVGGLPGLEEPTLTIFAADGRVLDHRGLSSLPAGEEARREALLAWLKPHEAPPWKAEERLVRAMKKARAGGLRLFVTFGAPWCGWCHRLQDRLHRAEVRERTARDFAFLHIDIERETGGLEVLERYRGTTKGGIPWFVILEDLDEVVATSDAPENLGCPATEEELRAFAGILRKAAPHMTPEDIEAVIQQFRDPAPETGG